jgi:hypothetical protein
MEFREDDIRQGDQGAEGVVEIVRDDRPPSTLRASMRLVAAKRSCTLRSCSIAGLHQVLSQANALQRRRRFHCGTPQ